MREFPLEHEEQKPIWFAPEQPSSCQGEILEIGPGQGDFFLRLAEAYPDKRCFAIELSHRRYRKIAKKIRNRELSNAWVIRANARVAIKRYFCGPTYDAIYIFFPDPWPKRRHAAHRLLEFDFFATLTDLLQPGGRMYLATDIEPYAWSALREASRVATLRNLGRPWIEWSEIEHYRPTFFQKVTAGEGRTARFMLFEKVGGARVTGASSP